MHKIAIIGASFGQKGLYEAAKRMGIYSIGFAWEQGAICKDLADEFIPISITDTDDIVKICSEKGTNGIVSSGSDFTALQTSIIADKLNLPGIPLKDFLKASNKDYVRNISNKITGFEIIKYFEYSPHLKLKFPVVVKPKKSGGKVGLSFANNEEEFKKAIDYANQCDLYDIIIEEYIDGVELSVETISSKGKHYIIQTCEAETSGPPHFVEIAHHLPANISKTAKEKIFKIVPELLNQLNITTGATDIEMKVKDDKVYLIEINLRAAGGNITNKLVELSTGYDYCKAQIMAALNMEVEKPQQKNFYVGDYYLCKQTESYKPLFDNAEGKVWLIEKNIQNTELIEVKTNADRENYIIYSSDHKITLSDIN